MQSIDTLLSLAEVAITLAGFSAIVVVFKRNQQGRWDVVHADQFHGMVIHAAVAVAFCVLPTALNVFVQDAATTLRIACAVLGVQVCLHSLGVMFFSTTSRLAKGLLSLGLLVGLLQFGVFTDWGAHREFDLYLFGIIWHILQAGLLFVMLIWVPAKDIDHPANDRSD